MGKAAHSTSRVGTPRTGRFVGAGRAGRIFLLPYHVVDYLLLLLGHPGYSVAIEYPEITFEEIKNPTKNTKATRRK